MSMSMSDLFKHRDGASFEKLNDTNYLKWSQNMAYFLRGKHLWTRVNNNGSARPAPKPINGQLTEENPDNDRNSVRENDAAILKYAEDTEEALSILFSACSDQTRAHFRGNDDPASVWNLLREKMNPAETAMGRQSLAHKFENTRYHPGEPVASFFERLVDIYEQLEGTKEPISESAFLRHAFKELPAQFEAIGCEEMKKEKRSMTTFMSAIKDHETLMGLRTSTQNSYKDHGPYPNPRERSRLGETRLSARGAGRTPSRPGKWCEHCENRSHNTFQCRKRNK